MKYKAEDRVKAKSLDWYNENKNKFGKVWTSGGQIPFDKCMSKWCGKVMTISDVRADHYTMIEDLIGYWTDEMIEGLVEDDVDLIPKFGEFSDNEPLDIPTMTTYFIKEHGLPCPNGYQFVDENGNVINATKIVLEKKEKEYPKTYDECCKVLNTDDDSIINISVPLHYNHLLISFTQLLICRDAYWKIAGEEMGLGKPWEPDWTNLEYDKFCIWVDVGDITFRSTLRCQHILVFPTAEMRDAFYENFKKEIEICKELL